MAELTTLAAAIYRTYRTVLDPVMEGSGPGITSRFEVFHDVTIPNVKASNAVCHWILLTETRSMSAGFDLNHMGSKIRMRWILNDNLKMAANTIIRTPVK
jgi:hypothetical protein